MESSFGSLFSTLNTIWVLFFITVLLNQRFITLHCLRNSPLNVLPW